MRGPKQVNLETDIFHRVISSLLVEVMLLVEIKEMTKTRR
jgi:hypothetical protein